MDNTTVIIHNARCINSRLFIILRDNHCPVKNMKYICTLFMFMWVYACAWSKCECLEQDVPGSSDAIASAYRSLIDIVTIENKH
jgi:hypothetical protein